MQVGSDKKISELNALKSYNAGPRPGVFQINNDPRITRVGTFLRNTKP